MGNTLVYVSIFLFFFLPQQFVTDHKPPCKNIEEYYSEEYGCRKCQPCKKGLGVNLTQEVNRTANGMLSCYSCVSCSVESYQDNEITPTPCQPCNLCENREILRNCSREANTVCGKRLPGIRERDKNCPYEKCIREGTEDYYAEFIVTLLILVAVMVLQIYLCMRK